MGWLNIVLFLYALLDIGLGTLGYINKNSLPSLLAGVLTGFVMLVSIVWARFNPRVGRIMSLVVALLLMFTFVPDTFIKNHIYPGGIMFTASLAVVICLGAGHMAGMKAKKAREAAQKLP